jgi:hypothetical protein
LMKEFMPAGRDAAMYQNSTVFDTSQSPNTAYLSQYVGTRSDERRVPKRSQRVEKLPGALF